MKYLSVCSGIEAASVAWHPLGWEPLAFSEIEPFPRAVLQHHYPQVPLHGDFTVLRNQPWIVDAGVLVGGTPCQAFSVAGLRNSLSDERGNLSLEFVRLADAIDNHRRMAGKDSAIIVWENVPGVLSVKDNAFGCFLAALAGDDSPYVPPRGKWTNAGVAAGPARTVAWRILDAQYFGLAQRRRRVFVIASARDGFDPAAVLLEFEGVRRDTPPRREEGKAASGGATGRAGERSHWDGLENPHPTLNQSAKGSGGVGASNQELFSQRGAYLVGDKPLWRAGDQANAETLEDMAGTLNCNKGQQGGILFDVTHSLRAEGFDAGEDGTGRGTPLVPVAFAQNTRDEVRLQGGDGQIVGALAAEPGMKQTTYVAVPLQEVGKRTGTSTEDPRAGIGIGEDGDPMYTLQAGAQHGVAYPLDLRNAGRDPEKHDEVNRQGVGVGEDGDPMHTLSTAFVPGVAYAFQPRIARNGRGDMGDVVNALNAQSGETGKGDAAPCVAVAFQPGNVTRGAGAAPSTDVFPTIKSDHGRGASDQQPHVMQHMAVRRLTPVECERLQGFPDGYTAIPWKKKPAEDCPDGPRYKALGNSMAVPVMRWIGKRIANAIA